MSSKAVSAWPRLNCQVFNQLLLQQLVQIYWGFVPKSAPDLQQKVNKTRLKKDASVGMQVKN